LAATLAYRTGCPHVSKRGLEEIGADVFDVPVSLGTIAHLEAHMSQALEQPHAEALAAVRAAKVRNVEETSWKRSGKRCWLWLAATQTVAAFVIHARRGLEGLVALLGERVQGWVGSDRWSVYAAIPAECRQICWAHLKRDFQKRIDRGGADAWGALLAGAFAHCFDEDADVPAVSVMLRKIDASKIQDDPDALVIFFKTALTTGWDCPRAEVMMSFRKAVDDTLIAQLVGRMVRTPWRGRWRAMISSTV